MVTRNININYNNDKQVAHKQRHPDSHYCTWGKETKKTKLHISNPEKQNKAKQKLRSIPYININKKHAYQTKIYEAMKRKKQNTKTVWIPLHFFPKRYEQVWRKQHLPLSRPRLQKQQKSTLD
jgi:hypothetical protein